MTCVPDRELQGGPLAVVNPLWTWETAIKGCIFIRDMDGTKESVSKGDRALHNNKIQV